MLSQTEMLRTLVNYNCTDEAVMSMVLSDGCTPTRLLEKLTEAERLDIALDISMKLGLDVTPLWRTWAMRCLQNCYFDQARDKFRLCFLRFKLPRGKSNQAQSELLSEILSTLVKLEESCLPKAEVVALIKKGVYIYDARSHRNSPITAKPVLYEECNYYLREYGTVEDLIGFNVKNKLWNEAVRVLIDKANQINAEKFFLKKVILPVTSTGQLKSLLDALMTHDSNLSRSTKYFKAIYQWCNRNKRYHLLHYVQDYIGDHIAAADTQLWCFFLRKPYRSYKELNQRITHLKSARKSYQSYLNKLELGEVKEDQRESDLFALMTREGVRRRLKLVDWQLDITHNFSINEITGNFGGVDLIFDGKAESTTREDSPITLFEEDVLRRTFLTALVLVYFDQSCSSYFSTTGLNLASNLMNWFKLERIKVFKIAMRIVMEDESCDDLEYAGPLLDCLRDDYRSNVRQYHAEMKSILESRKVGAGSGTNRKASGSEQANTETEAKRTSKLTKDSDKTVTTTVQTICDEVIRDSIESCKEPDYKMEFAKLLSGEAKIELYIQHGKLSNAQRLACNMNRPDYVLSIINEATRLNQNHVKTVCQVWLTNYETRNLMR